MRLHNHLIVVFMLGAAFACAAGPALADAPAAPAAGDVTMTVIPSGVDVVKTVVQNISVPSNADKVAKAKSAPPPKATAGQDSEATQTAQQLAETAAQHQVGQTQQQVQQQALQAAQIAAAKARNPPPPPPPPPPRPPGRG